MGAMPRTPERDPGRYAHFRAKSGHDLKTFFTIQPPARYAGAMFMLLAAAIAVPAPEAAPAPPVRATVRATASVRIISGVTIAWGTASSDVPKLRVTKVRDATGAAQPIRLIEFE